MIVGLLQTTGIIGIPTPYSPQKDDLVALILLVCFFITSFVLARSKRQIWLQLRSLAFQRERSSLFAGGTTIDIRLIVLLLLQTCIFLGMLFFNYFNDVNPVLMVETSPNLLLVIYIGICVGYLLFKWLFYLFAGWVFFEKIKTNLWMESYITMLYTVGFILFPLVLLLIYFNLSVVFLIVFGLILLACVKILMFYKWLRLFSNNFGGFLLLILYFCALEIIPGFILYRGLVELNNLLIIKI